MTFSIRQSPHSSFSRHVDDLDWVRLCRPRSTSGNQVEGFAF
jgi:hypothetical protein